MKVQSAPPAGSDWSLTSDLEFITDAVGDVWADLKHARLFMTGGTGFIGCWLLDALRHADTRLGLGLHVTVLTRDPNAFHRKAPHLASYEGFRFVAGDVSDFTSPDGSFSHLIHAATDASAELNEKDPRKMFGTVVEGTRRALDFAVEKKVPRCLFLSSGAVYGEQPAAVTHIPESYTGAPDPVDPANVYAEGKRTAELLCGLYQKTGSLDCKIARCWAFCGPYLPLDQHFAIGNFIGDVLAGRPIQIKGDGSPRRSYLYAADLAVWLWTILFRAPALVPFNVGSAHDVSISELAQTVASTLDPQTEIRVARQAVAGASPRRYVPCIDRAQQVLGLRQIVGLEECIRRTAKWHSTPDALA